MPWCITSLVRGLWCTLPMEVRMNVRTRRTFTRCLAELRRRGARARWWGPLCSGVLSLFCTLRCLALPRQRVPPRTGLALTQRQCRQLYGTGVATWDRTGLANKAQEAARELVRVMQNI